MGCDVECQIMSNGRSITGHAPKAASCGSKEASCVEPTDCNAEQLRHQACTASGERQQWGRNAVSCWRLQGKHMLVLSADTRPSRPIPKAFLISSGVGFLVAVALVDGDILGSLAEGARVRRVNFLKRRQKNQKNNGALTRFQH